MDSKTIILTLADRFALIGKLPQRGRMQVMATANSLRKKLEITSQDVSDYEIKELSGEDKQLQGVSWNPTVDTSKEFTIDNEAEVSLLVKIVKDMDENEEITIDFLNVAQLLLDLESNVSDKVSEAINQEESADQSAEQLL